MDFKNIDIGKAIKVLVEEKEIDINRICLFFKCNEFEVSKMYEEKDLSADIILKWSKLLSYDFFRLYSQHLILYSPKSTVHKSQTSVKESQLPKFRKHLYTREIIDFILEQINNKKMTKNQIIEEYNIPKTTLHKWLNKYSVNERN